MTRTRKTRDLCQPCWYDDNPDLYFPDGNRYGTCAVCGADTLVHRSSIPDPNAAGDIDCGPVVNPDGTPTAMTLHVLRGDPAPDAYFDGSDLFNGSRFVLSIVPIVGTATYRVSFPGAAPSMKATTYDIDDLLSDYGLSFADYLAANADS